MSDLKIQFAGPTGNYYVNIYDTSGFVYVSQSGLFKNFLLNEQSNYAIELTGIYRQGIYYNNINFTANSGVYSVDFLRKIGLNIDRTNDLLLLCDNLYWDGDNEIDFSSLNSQNNRFTFDGNRVNASTTGFNFNPGIHKVTLATGLHTDAVIPLVNTISNPVSLDSYNVYTTGFTNEAISGLLNSPVEAGVTVNQVFRLIGAALGGSRAGGGTSTITFKGLDNSTTRITMQVDNNGNSTSNPTLTL
jgi:hypothetical protein